MSDETIDIIEDSSSHLLRWLVLIALALVAAAVARQIAMGAADRQFEERLQELDDTRE